MHIPIGKNQKSDWFVTGELKNIKILSSHSDSDIYSVQDDDSQNWNCIDAQLKSLLIKDLYIETFIRITKNNKESTCKHIETE